jgi:hypothetical protein
MSVTYGGHTTWLEMKRATPYFEKRPLQHLVLTRLAREGRAYYVVYSEVRGVKETRIMLPERIDTWKTVAAYAGWDHDAVIRVISGV